MNEISPCKGCTDRYVACHDTCEAYMKWRERYHAQQKHLEANKARWLAPWSKSREDRTRNYYKHGAGSFKGGNQ